MNVHLSKLYLKLVESDLMDRAAQVAFYFSFALFPLLFFLVSLFGLILVSTEALKGELYDYLYRIMPSSAFELVRRTVDEIVASSSPGKLTLGLAITLWSASAGIDSLRSALNSVYGLTETRSWWKTKLLSLTITLISIILIAAVLLIVFYGWQLVQATLATVGLEVTSPLVLVSIQWISIFLVMLLACEVIYNLVPDFKNFRWLWITPGSIVAIALWIIFTGGFRLYLEYFNAYNRTYGSLGAVIILMLWLYLTAVAVLLGG
ncbi:MAG: YihY/virulence factor BrkB family protein, partial [Blastocatellia bacterium]|nr:YihY/virulence factor BrkB family protein [Blastocatellia bacterium]